MHKKILRLSFKASILAMALAVLPMGANAAGLGRITVLSALGQPLRAEVELTASREELSSLSARLASHDAFKQAGIEFVPALSSIKLVIDKRTAGKPVIRMTTDRPINEPFLDLLIELNWTAGRLVREYTFLLDPAPDVLARKPVASPAAKSDSTSIAQPSPVASPKQPELRADDKPRTEKPGEAKPAGEAQGREVQKGEYLRKIAAEAQYDGVSLDQMLVAIFRSNKDAFIDNNMHRLKAGRILNIPDREAVAAVDGREARKTISAHTADFNAYRQKLASAVAGAEAPKEDAAKQVATGKIGAKVEDKAPAPTEAKDQLKVSKAESAKDARLAQGKIAALEEDLAAKDRALKEAQSRQVELEKNLRDLEKLVELKNQNLAELQKQAAAKAAPVPAAPAKAPEPAPAAAAVPAAAEKPAEPVKPVEAAPPAKPVESAKPAEAPKPAPKKAPPPPPPPPEPDFIDEVMGNPAILGGGVLVLGLLGFVAYRQRQKKKQHEDGEAPPTTTANLTANSVFGATGGQSVDTTGSSMATDFSQASISAIDADEGVDPVAEADVYMAYGRDAQAEEILLDALKTDPTRTAIHVKLLEIYAGRKNNKQFETLASDLYAQTGGVGGDWEKAAAMGLKLDPANPLFGGATGDKQSVNTDTTIIVPAGETKQMRDTWTMPGELSQISEAVEKGGAATVILEKPVEASLEAPATAAAPALDFDLDLGAPAAAPAAPAPAAAAPAAAEAAGLDFDLGLDFKPAESKPAAAEYNPEATMIMDVAKASKPPAADLALDIKLDEPAAAQAADEGLHFDLDLGEPAAPATPASQPIDLEKTLAGGNALDFDFNIGAPAAPQTAPQAEPDIDLGSISLDLGEPASPAAEPAAGDEVTTKLELAKAYEEMGDKEGARELLTEVAKEGNAEQQAKAQSMLAKLG
ncbi:MAG: FimV/HubP family polar landmark protein [Denitratisoma sp.]|nr:FimV/HubP family polar landmark protein [Denitratisoma sp.]